MHIYMCMITCRHSVSIRGSSERQCVQCVVPEQIDRSRDSDGEYCQHRCLGRCVDKKGAWRKDCIGFSPLLPLNKTWLLSQIFCYWNMAAGPGFSQDSKKMWLLSQTFLCVLFFKHGCWARLCTRLKQDVAVEPDIFGVLFFKHGCWARLCRRKSRQWRCFKILFLICRVLYISHGRRYDSSMACCHPARWQITWGGRPKVKEREMGGNCCQLSAFCTHSFHFYNHVVYFHGWAVFLCFRKKREGITVCFGWIGGVGGCEFWRFSLLFSWVCFPSGREFVVEEISWWCWSEWMQVVDSTRPFEQTTDLPGEGELLI